MFQHNFQLMLKYKLKLELLFSSKENSFEIKRLKGELKYICIEDFKKNVKNVTHDFNSL